MNRKRVRLGGKWFGGHKGRPTKAAMVDTWLGMSTNPLEF